MQISFYSALMSVLWGSLFCIVLALLRRFKRGYLYYNIAPLSILLFGCIFRCVLPLDFPGFTINLEYSTFYASINTALYTPVIITGENGQGITPLMIFFAIWVTGALVLSARFLWIYFRKMYFLNIYEDVESGPAYEIAAALCEKQKIKKFRILKDVSIKVPHVCGFLYPRVLLPDVEYTETDLRYILAHELAHWKNGDMWVRFITILICYIFWWNPIIYLLLYRMNETLEFRCDATVVNAHCIENSDEERKNYLNTLKRASEDVKKARKKRSQLFSVESELLGHSMSKEDFKRRLDIIGDYERNPKKERRIAIFTAAIMAVVLVFSYRFILQPYYYVDKETFDDRGGIQMTPENTYLLEENDGTFSVYIDNKFYKNITYDSAQTLISIGFNVESEKRNEE